jgi:hypothetical protein
MGRYGTPAKIITDQGPAFMSDLFDALVSFSGNEHFRGIPYSKAGTSIVERCQKENIRHLRAITHDLVNTDKWSACTPLVQRIWNSIKHGERTYTPAELVFGNSVDLDRRILYHPKYGDEWERFVKSGTTDEKIALNKYMTDLLDLQQIILNAAYRERLIQNHTRLQNHTPRPITEFNIGEYVLVQPPERASKLDPTWLGPSRVVDRKQDAYTLQNLIDGARIVRHVSTLKPFHTNDPLAPQATAASDHGEFMVERIVSHTPPNPTRENGQFIVKWKGFTDSFNTPQDWASLNDNDFFHDYCMEHNLIKLIPKRFRDRVIARHNGTPLPETHLRRLDLQHLHDK